MQKFFADMHIHVGKAENGKWVKMATSQRLTVRNILLESAARKGMDMIGIVDALSPWVLDDIKRLYQEGVLIPDSGGGYRAEGLMLLLGAEIETVEEDGSMAHTLVYLPDILRWKNFRSA